MTGSKQRTRIALLALATALVLTAPAVGAAAAATAPATAPDAPAYVPWQTAADAPFAFWRFDAEYSLSTGKIFVLGGRLADGSTDGSIWSFDPETGVYADTLVDLPVPVSNYEIARLFDAAGTEYLVLFGGRNSAGTVVNTVQAYLPATNTTMTFAADPYPVATSPGAVAVVHDKAYVFGGFNATLVIASTFIFDIKAADGGRWSVGPDLSLARSYIAEAVVDGVIYAVGGDTWDGAALVAQTIVEKLDTNAAVLAWDDAGVADLPIACDETRAFGFGAGSPYDLANSVVVAGCGQWGATPSELVNAMIYDVTANTWDDAGFPDINMARRNHAGALVPWGSGSLGRPGIWIWGGRQALDTTILATPEFYAFTSAVIFIDGFEVGSTGAWSSTVP